LLQKAHLRLTEDWGTEKVRIMNVVRERHRLVTPAEKLLKLDLRHDDAEERKETKAMLNAAMIKE
jgi:hypothetical protein